MSFVGPSASKDDMQIYKVIQLNNQITLCINIQTFAVVASLLINLNFSHNM